MPQVSRRACAHGRVTADREPGSAFAHIASIAREEGCLARPRPAEVRYEIRVEMQPRAVADEPCAHENHRARAVGGKVGHEAETVQGVVDAELVGERPIVGHARGGDALRGRVEEARSVGDQVPELAEVVAIDCRVEQIGKRAVDGREPHERRRASSRADRVFAAAGPVIGRRC